MNKIRNTKDFYNHKYSVLDTVIKGTTMTKTASTNKEAQCGMSVSEGMNAALQGGTGIKPQGVIETYGPVVSGLSCPMHGVQKTLHNDEMFDKIKEYMDQEDTDDFDNGYKGYDDKDKIDADKIFYDEPVGKYSNGNRYAFNF